MLNLHPDSYDFNSDDMVHDLPEIYDRFADVYESNRGLFDVHDIFDEFYAKLPPTGALLDLGCGAGEPFARWFLERGWSVTGVDFSPRMLELARRHAPEMQTHCADMTEVQFPSNSFDAVIAVYSLFHVPRQKHPGLFGNFGRWLKPGGQALFTYATQEYTGHTVFDGTKEFLGEQLFYSHDEESALLSNLERSGLQVKSSKKREIGGETFLWMTVARPTANKP